MGKSLCENLQGLDRVSLDEMSEVSLLKRTDTKYLLSKSLLPDILKEISSQYYILEIAGARLMEYRTLYFDTPEMKFYYDHHNGKVIRTKVRIRNYVNSNRYFFEIKNKNYRGTIKSRMPISDFSNTLSSPYRNFVNHVTNKTYILEPSLWNSFQRFTLVNFHNKERVTVDLNISFSMKGREKVANELAIIELKQEKFNRASTIVRALQRFNIHSKGFSKYCVGLTLTDPTLKANTFKPKILSLNKISK